MKDAHGHGSNSKLTKTQGPSSAIPHFAPKAGKKGLGPIHGGAPGNYSYPSTGGGPSNAQAAQSLMSTLKSTQAPIHPAMDKSGG
jgi:hypothetical protein